MILPQYVKDQIKAEIARTDKFLPAHIDRSDFYRAAADKIITEYEAKQAAKRNTSADSAAVSWLFSFIDDAPTEATALFKGSRHIN